MTSKQQCQQKLDYVRDAFWFSLAGYALATKQPTMDYLEKFRINLSGDEIHVLEAFEKPKEDWLSYEVSFGRALKDGAAETAVKQVFYYMILETFEAAKKYAEQENLFDDFKSQDFYSFSRHLRNAIGHNGIWTIKPNIKDLPATFRNKTINVSLNAQPIDGFVDWVFGLQLCAAISVWVSNST